MKKEALKVEFERSETERMRRTKRRCPTSMNWRVGFLVDGDVEIGVR
jgi:hypothetical protein